MKTIFQSADQVKAALPKGKSFTLVGGSFDLLHVGHVHVLEHAALLESMLVVAVLSDSYIQKYKGAGRPIMHQEQRARMVSSLRCVNFVYISEVSPSSPEALRVLLPDRVVFDEEDQRSKQMQIRSENIRAHSPHTKIDFVPRYDKEKISTTSIIDSILGKSSR